jgi:hypothetical protein
MGKIYQCARGLCWEIMTLKWNKWATFNFVITSHLIFMTWGTLLVEEPIYLKSVKSCDFWRRAPEHSVASHTFSGTRALGACWPQSLPIVGTWCPCLAVTFTSTLAGDLWDKSCPARTERVTATDSAHFHQERFYRFLCLDCGCRSQLYHQSVIGCLFHCICLCWKLSDVGWGCAFNCETGVMINEHFLFQKT